jgi:hypothetical protein
MTWDTGKNAAVFGTQNTASTSNRPMRFTQYNTGGSVDRITIDASGNVGIGTVAPSNALLDISGDMQSRSEYRSGSSGLFSTVKYDTGPGAAIHGSLNTNTTDNVPIHFTQFNTGGFSNRMLIDTNGNVGIGTQSPAGIFDVSAAATNPAFFRTPTYMRVPIRDISTAATTSVAVDLSASGLYYNITNSAFNTITLISGITTASAGAFWTFRNNTAGSLSVTISNRGTAASTITTPLSIPASNAATIAVSAFSNDCYVLL